MLHVYVFAHFHDMQQLWQKFQEDKEEKVLFCEEKVAPYFNMISNGYVEVLSYRSKSLGDMAFRSISSPLIRLTKKRVRIYTGSPMGSQLIEVARQYRIKEVRYVNHYQLEVLSPLQSIGWRYKLAFIIFNVFLMKQVRIYSWSGITEFGLSGCQYDPPQEKGGKFPKWDHNFDLIILDFDLSFMNLDLHKTNQMLEQLFSEFNSIGVKPHPTHKGTYCADNFDLKVLPSWIPAESLSGRGVSCLVLESTASESFERSLNVLDFLVING